MSMSSMKEEFKPIPVRRSPGLVGDILFHIRMMVDLQLLTCMRFLKPHLTRFTGKVLDVGCGEMPFRSMLGKDAIYTGIDVAGAQEFGMQTHPDIVAFDGVLIPFPDATFDHIMCTEVLEHVESPHVLVEEMRRVLRIGGTIVVTVPFAARVHHAPYDFQRLTCFALRNLFSAFEGVVVVERGDDFAVVANKLIAIAVRLLSPKPIFSWLWRLPIFLLLAPFLSFALCMAHLSLLFGWGSRTDPLGYAIYAVKS